LVILKKNMKAKILKEALSILPDLLKDKNKKWSAKRTISGVLVGVISTYLQSNPMSWMVIAFTLVAVAPLCLSFFESKDCECK
tara:strand:- start:2592 stop:2840 length:249 start_codon:yes stop_codon:yes gene_type:complete